MVRKYSRELSPAAEQEIWKRLKKGEHSHELLQLAVDDGLAPFDAERIVGEMRMAVQLVGNSRQESVGVRLGMYYGPPIALGGLFISGLLLVDYLRLPTMLWWGLMCFSVYAIFFGVSAFRRAWSGR